MYSGVPNHLVISSGEAKPKNEVGHPQAIRYTWQRLEARPDMPGVYGFFVNAKVYNIIWSDTSGPVISPPIPWENLGPLECYIHSLYCPPSDHPLWDPSITNPTLLEPSETAKPRSPGEKIEAVPHWTIEFKGKIYKDCYLFQVGDCWGRRTTVFMHDGDDEDDFAVIKDSYPDERRRFDEIELFEHIHEGAIFPGVARVLDAGDVEGNDGEPIVTPRPAVDGPEGVARRGKKRLVMGSRGSRLTAAKSVRDILMAIYDGTEGMKFPLFLMFPLEPDTLSLIVHRALVNQKHYLHRDISLYNFLIYPLHAKGSMGKKKLIEKLPKFIKDILGIDW